MELFSEIYGCYYSVVARILAHEDGITQAQADEIAKEYAFSESGLHLIPRLLGGEWKLMNKENGKFISKLKQKETGLPVTALQKAWLKALLLDRRIRLFLDEEKLAQASDLLSDVEPLFYPNDFNVFDSASDCDDYGNELYIQNFRTVLEALKNKKSLLVQYESGKDKRFALHFFPQKLLYSAKDDKFRVRGIHIYQTRTNIIVLNMARIQKLADSNRTIPKNLTVHPAEGLDKRTVHAAISKERNALERCMLQFAFYDKQTFYDESAQRYVCSISYDSQDETEVLIRLLSFGPVIEVLGPPPFLKLVRERISAQMECMKDNC